jgi:hypothetical protein
VLRQRSILGLIDEAGIDEPWLHKEVRMTKKYIVRLTDAERRVCDEVVGELKGASQKARRARILLKADADGPAWTDEKICEAFGCREQTVEGIRQRFVTEGFEIVLNGKAREKPPTDPKLDGVAEAKVIALRLGTPPAGYGRWTLRLLAERVVELEIVDAISHETIRKTLKKRHDQAQDRVLGDPSGSRRRVRGLSGGGAGNLCESLRSTASGRVHGRATRPADR